MDAPSSAEGTKPAPPEFQQDGRQFKSKAPKPGQKRLPEMGEFDDSAVICPWEDFGDTELSKLAEYGIV